MIMNNVSTDRYCSLSVPGGCGMFTLAMNNSEYLVQDLLCPCAVAGGGRGRDSLVFLSFSFF